jgi:hypothetical protein
MRIRAEQLLIGAGVLWFSLIAYMFLYWMVH